MLYWLKKMGVLMSFEEDPKTLVLEANLTNQRCGLFHIKSEKLPKAIDYIVLNMGVGEEVAEQLTIPACEECIKALLSNKWILLFCTHCCESRWVNKSRSKRLYLYENAKDNILWLDECPECKERLKSKKQSLIKNI